MDDLGAFDAVIFDLDGVIVDTEIWWDEVRAEYAHGHGRDWTEEDRHAVMGANSPTWSRIMAQRLDLALPPKVIESAIVAAMVARYQQRGAPAIPGAVDAVRRVALQRPVAVASSAHPDVIAAALEGTGLASVFSAVVSSDEVALGKPDPAVYLEAARRLGVEPARCLVVEDSLNGLRAGRAAGMTVALVPNRSIPPAPGASEIADLVLPGLALLVPVARSGAAAAGDDPEIARPA
jgi:HAD superfamily hydrolase (TIGR01509 family)